MRKKTNGMKLLETIINNPSKELLREVRQAAGWSLVVAAETLGVAKPTYIAWEQGRTRMPPAAWWLFLTLAAAEYRKKSI